MRVFLKYWLPVVVWLGIIFFGSTDLLSAQHTSRILVPFLLWLKPNMTIETVMLVQLLVRKAAHLTEYAILAVIIWRALYYGTTFKAKMWILCAAVWIAAGLVAVSDEYHQAFVPSRGATWRDVLIDVTGAMLGLGIYSVFLRKRSQNLKAENGELRTES